MDIPNILYYILIFILLAYGLIVTVKENISNIKDIVLKAVIQAEIELSKGDDKYEYVSNLIYDKLPTYIKVFLTKNMITKITKKLVENAIKTIKDNQGSIISNDTEVTIENLIKELKNK